MGSCYRALGFPADEARHATNGRGHPIVKMGGMGPVGRSDVRVIQAAAGGLAEEGRYLEVVVRGSMAGGATLLHHASDEAGGSVAACRGPFSAAFCRQAGATGAISACIRLGEAMLDAQGKGGTAAIAAIVDTLGGRELGRELGPVVYVDAALAVS